MVDELLKYNYEDLVNCLDSLNYDDKRKILSDNRIKKKMILDYDSDFEWFCQNFDTDIIPLLLENDGIKMFKKSGSFKSTMLSILTLKYDYLDDLFKNEKFMDLLVDYYDSFISSMYNLKNENFMILYNKYDSVNEKYSHDLLKIANSNNQHYFLLHNDNISHDIYKYSNLCGEVLQEYIDKYKSYIDFNTKPLDSFYDLIDSKNINFPIELLHEVDFVNRLVTDFDIQEYRYIINELEKNNDVDFIEEKRKKFYDNILNSYNEETGLLKIFENFYNIYNVNNKEELQSTLDMFFGKSKGVYFFGLKEAILNTKSKEELLTVLQKESSIQISNIIVDYHFKDQFDNVLYNVEQVVDFNIKNDKSIKVSSLEVYKKLLLIDNLSIKEKFELHNELNQFNYVDVFYDDYTSSKKEAIKMMKKEMLNEEKIKAFKKDGLSKKAGVDIFVLENKPYYSLVKCLPVSKKDLLEERYFVYNVDGASYSLDSSYKLDTFYNTKDYYTIMYTDFKNDQVAHILSVDSYSNYDRENNVFNRVYEILSPNDLVTKTKEYDEIVLVQKNNKNPTDYDDQIPAPKPFAIYCYDHLCKNDLESAKKLGLSIVIVNTKSYNNGEEKHKQESLPNLTYGNRYSTHIFESNIETRRTKM